MIFTVVVQKLPLSALRVMRQLSQTTRHLAEGCEATWLQHIPAYLHGQRPPRITAWEWYYQYTNTCWAIDQSNLPVLQHLLHKYDNPHYYREVVLYIISKQNLVVFNVAFTYGICNSPHLIRGTAHLLSPGHTEFLRNLRLFYQRACTSQAIAIRLYLQAKYGTLLDTVDKPADKPVGKSIISNRPLKKSGSMIIRRPSHVPPLKRNNSSNNVYQDNPCLVM